MLTQLVTGRCCCLEDKTLVSFFKSWVEEGVDTFGVTGCFCCLEDKTFLEILVRGEC